MNADDSIDRYQRRFGGQRRAGDPQRSGDGLRRRDPPPAVTSLEDGLLQSISRAGDEKTRARLHTQLIVLREKNAARAVMKPREKVLQVAKAPEKAKPQSASEILLKQEQSKPATIADFDVVK